MERELQSGHLIRVHPVAAEVGEHVDEFGMASDGSGANEVQVVFLGGRAGDEVEVVQHLDVVAEEADGGGDNGVEVMAASLPDEVVDVRLCPRDGGMLGTALVGEMVAFPVKLHRHQGRGSTELTGVGGGVGGGLRDGVRGEDQHGVPEFDGAKAFGGFPNQLGNRGDVSPVAEPRFNVVHHGLLPFDLADGIGHGLLVPIPTHFGLVGRHDDRQDVAMPVFHHSRNDLVHEGRPVAKSGVDRHVNPPFGERGAERIGLLPRQLVERGEPAELGIVAGDLVYALGF